MNRCIILLTFFFSWISVNEALCAQRIQNYFIKQSSTNVRYDVGGNADESAFLWPSMPSKKRFVSSITIKNTGDNVLINPRVSINGHQIPLTTAELLSSITRDGKDPLDRLLRIYHAVDRYSIHKDLFLSKLQDSPLKSFVAYGGGMCEDRANIQSMLWDVMGHKWRNSRANNHTVDEVEYGHRLLHLDTDIQAYYLMHDNWTVASSQDLRDDPMLVLRAVNYRNYMKYPRGAEDPETDMWYSSEKVAALFGDDNREPLSSNAPVSEKFEILLRPGEAYGWHSDKPKHIHPIFSESSLSDTLRDFIWETRLDFSKSSHRWAVRKTSALESPIRDDAVYIDKNTSIFISYGHPFPMTGADLRLYPERNVSPKSMIKLTIKGGEGKTASFDIPLAKLTSGDYSLSSHIQKSDFPVHTLQIEIGLSDSGITGNKIPLKGLSFKLYSQATVYAFPSLKAGRNHLIYSDATDRRSVALQVDAIPMNVAPSGFSEKSLFDPNHKMVAEKDLIFSWPESEKDVKGYQFQISAFADMRYPLSPTFDRIVYKQDITELQGRIQFQLPWRGMLPLNRDLYWRVRPFGEDLLAGHWSGTFPFKVRGPQAPEKINIQYDHGKVILSWSASKEGTRPLYYQIHSSSLEGFIPMSEPHRILGLGDQTEAKYTWHDVTAADWPVVPGNSLTTTKETKIVLLDGTHENESWLSKLGAHFRVIAVDEEGSRSCPSRQAHLKSPWIVLPDIMEFNPGDITFRVPVLSTLGRITAASPYFLGLWHKPVLKYSISSSKTSKGKWSVDENLGVIKGRLADQEDLSFSVTVQDQFNRKNSKQIHIKAK
jgi:hypothetical protein